MAGISYSKEREMEIQSKYATDSAVNLAAGMNDDLTKPLDKEKMLAAVGKYKK